MKILSLSTSPVLSDSEKRDLLLIARRSIESAVMKSHEPFFPLYTPALSRPAGAFVTLRQEDELRGCIGFIESQSSLAETVIDSAANAALDDPRFDPVTPAEVARLEIEISVISPLKRIYSAQDIDPGTHGLVVEFQGRRGVLLPQVALEFGWNRETFLEETARKAGVPKAAIRRQQLIIYVFEAEVFDERSLYPPLVK